MDYCHFPPLSSRTGSSSSSVRSSESRHTQITNITSASDYRPSVKRWDTCPAHVGRGPDQGRTSDEETSPRSSILTYASTVPSETDLSGLLEYVVPTGPYECYPTDVLASTPAEFAGLFPTTRRLLIQHDDSTSDGNMNLRIDTEVLAPSGRTLKMTLFHLRMKDLNERLFSLRRYCRDSGREVASSKKKYLKPTATASKPKRPMLQRSLTSALQVLRIKGSSTPKPEDNMQPFAIPPEANATIPTNIIRLEFSNYAQVEVHRCRTQSEKSYAFEYWGEPYAWRRERRTEGEETFHAFHLSNLATDQQVAYVMPDALTREETRREREQGGWVPPCSMRINEAGISSDLGDVIIATGLIALTDDCIRSHWHSSDKIRLAMPRQSADDYVHPEQLVEEVFGGRMLHHR